MNGTIPSLKRKIMMTLASDSKIFELLDNQSIDKDSPDDLIYVNIFPYLKVDYTIQEAGTYIGVKLEYPKIDENEIYKDAQLTFLVVSANRHIKTSDGYARTDLIGEEILKIFNWNDHFGFTLKLVGDTEDPVDENFYYRKLVFKSVSPNSMKNGDKVN